MNLILTHLIWNISCVCNNGVLRIQWKPYLLALHCRSVQNPTALDELNLPIYLFSIHLLSAFSVLVILQGTRGVTVQKKDKALPSLARNASWKMNRTIGGGNRCSDRNPQALLHAVRHGKAEWLFLKVSDK